MFYEIVLFEYETQHVQMTDQIIDRYFGSFVCNTRFNVQSTSIVVSHGSLILPFTDIYSFTQDISSQNKHTPTSFL